MKKPLNFVLLAAIASAIIACNGGNNSSTQPTNSSNLSLTLTPINTPQKVKSTNSMSDGSLSSAICQDGTCTWNNSANNNITQGENDNTFCTGTNSKQHGTGYTLGSGAYGMTFPTGIAPTATGYGKTDVILELFNTPYANISQADLQNYYNIGYTTIWISPPQYSAAVNYNNTDIPAWYGAYQPMNFGQIGNESNPMTFGSASDLATLVTNAHKVGLQVIVDVAIHQFAAPGAQSSPGNATNYYSGSSSNPSSFYWPQTSVSGYIPFNNIWGGKSTCAASSGTVMEGTNPGNATSMWGPDFADTNAGYSGLPAGSNSSSWVNPTTGGSGASCNTQSIFDGYAAWLLGLNNKGGNMSAAASATTGFNVDGFRIDDISGQSTTFWNQLFSDTSAYNESSNIFFGEYPNSSASAYDSYTAIKTASGNNASNNTMKMLNFPLLAGLVSAFSPGGSLQASLSTNNGNTGMISSGNAYTSSSNGTLAGTNAINLVMDQDTVPDSINSRAMCPWSGSNEFTMNYYNAPLAYGVILAMEPGTPFIYADLQAQAGVGIGPGGTSSATYANGSVSYWNENEVLAGVYFHNQTLGMTMTWANVNATDADNVAALTRGTNYFFIVNKSATVYQASDSSTGLTNQCYIDLMSHQIVNVTNGALNNLIVPAQSVMYFVPYTGAVPSAAGFSC
jgi:glycosidase